MEISYNGRRFRTVSNTPNGQATDETIFEYKQEGDLVSAVYRGGGIRLGAITGLVLEDGTLRFCYQHVSESGELRSGVCDSQPEVLADGRVRLHERWKWTLGEDPTEGESVVEEIPLDRK
jgi:hypothetical protein